jgi:hypothetical protein
MKNYRKVKVNRAVTGEGNRSVITICLCELETSGFAYCIAPNQNAMRNVIDTLLDLFGASIIDGIAVITKAQIDQHAHGDLANFGWFIVSDYQPATSK